MRKNLPSLIVAAIVVAAILLTMCTYQVRFTETVVVTRFDNIRYVVEPQEAGWHGKLPWPIDQVHRYDARLRTFETEFRQLGTEDQKTIVLTAYATWRIADAQAFLKAVYREDAAVQKIRDLLENRVSIVLRTHALGDLVNSDPQKLKFEQVEREIHDGIRTAAMEKYGIDINTVGIKRLGIPEGVTREVFARMKEDRQRAIKELQAEGSAKATEIKVAAEEAASKILARADAYSKKIEAQGDAEAAKFLKFFAENATLSNFLKKRETLLEIFRQGNMTLVIDAAKLAPFELLRDVGMRTVGTNGLIAPTAETADDEATAPARPVAGPDENRSSNDEDAANASASDGDGSPPTP